MGELGSIRVRRRSVRRAHCANAKEGWEEERRSVGEAITRIASILSGRREGIMRARGA